jgi:hypothetical protein
VIHSQRQHGWKALLAITVVIGLLLLLVLHISGDAGAVPACFVLMQVLFFGLVDVPRSLWPLAEISLTIRHQILEPASLFQRPPPPA